MFESCVDLLAQFFGIAPKTIGLLAEPFQFSEPQFVGRNHALSLKRVRGRVTEKH